MEQDRNHVKGFVPYALAAFLIGMVGGFAAVLGPAFVADLGIAYSATTWTALAQAMSTAAWAPILGKLGDVLGQKMTLMLGLLAFTAGTILTALAPSLTVMLVARFLVGLGTAAMAPVILAYIVTEFPPDRVGKGVSVYMLISSGAVIFGPTLGSVIIGAWGWRAMIWLCTLICLVITALCLLLGEKFSVRRKKVENFDGAGAVFVVLFFSLLLCVPAFAQNFGWTSGPFLVALVAAVLCLWGLVMAERRAAHPILPGGFIRRRSFLLSVLALFLTQGLMQANMTNTIVFQSYTQPGSIGSGIAISVMYLGMALGAVVLGPLASRKGHRRVLTGSLVLTGIGCGTQLLFSEDTPLALLMAALGVLGFGLGGNGTVFTEVALAGLSPAQAGSGSGTYGLFRDLAAPFGVAVFVPLFTNQITAKIGAGLSEAAAAVQAVHLLGAVEVVSVAAGIVLVRLLPDIQGGERV